MNEDKDLSFLEMFIMALSLYSIASIVVSITIWDRLSTELQGLVLGGDYLCSGVFLSEWFYRFSRAENKKRFAMINCLDLAASLPWVALGTNIISWMMRSIKVAGNITRLGSYMLSNEWNPIKYGITIPYLFILMLSPGVILYLEENVGNIKSGEDALWWVYCTVTTIGYGDFYPVTGLGRLLTAILGIGGISMFGLFGSIVFTKLTENKKKNEKNSSKSS